MGKTQLPPQRKSTRNDRRVKSRILTRLRSKSQQIKKVRFQFEEVETEKLLTRSAARSLFSSISLLELPNELLAIILSFCNAKELMLLRCISQKFKNLIDYNQSIWTRTSFQDLWPSTCNQDLFARGVEAKNQECLVKLGLAHLYHYNLTVGAEKTAKEVKSNALIAASYLQNFDRNLFPKKPTTWMLIRPPWSSSKSICLKQAVHHQLTETKIQTRNGDPSVSYNIGRVFNLDIDADCKQKSSDYLKLSSKYGSMHAAFELLMQKKNIAMADNGNKLKWFRDLYECACLGNVDASFELCKYIASGESKNYLLQSQALPFFQQMFSFAKCSRVERLEQYQPKINGLMRCILVDWLAEVAYMKDMSHQVLHAAVQYVDRFLTARVIERTKLQLLGITCLLLAAKSHFDSRQVHILTVRESSWLTDQTYQYDDVVKMMGEVIGTFKGDLWAPTSWDYLNLLLTFKEIDSKTSNLAHYLHDISLQFTVVGGYKSSVLASSILFLARIILKEGTPWPDVVSEFTGLQVKDLANCASMIYFKSFTCPSVKDDRDLPLKSIKEEYCSPKHGSIAKTLIPLQLEIKRLILEADTSLSCVSQDPLNFVVMATDIDETLNTSVKSIDYDGDCEDLNDPLSDSSFEESFCVGRSRLSSLRSVDDFSDDETTMDAEDLNFNNSGLWIHSPRESFTPIFNSMHNHVGMFGQKQKKRYDEGNDGRFFFPGEPCYSEENVVEDRSFLSVDSDDHGKQPLKRKRFLEVEVGIKERENMVSKRTRSSYAIYK